MPFKSLLDLFKKDDWSNQLVGQIGQMLEIAAEMFAYAVGVIVYAEKDHSYQSEIFDQDIRINELEREIRRRVVARLSTTSTRADVPTALIFMNTVKDVERIGDYIKNFYQIKKLMRIDIDREMVQEHLVGRSRTLEDLFVRTGQAFLESDEAAARDVIERARILASQAEELIVKVSLSALRTADAVSLVLALRFYKRIAAHMANIATCVVMPVDKMDFYDEPGRPDRR